MHVDVLVVGAGQAGVPLATRLAAAGKRVVIAERAEPGGTCINYGCTPTKTMIASARAAHVARTADRLGVHGETAGLMKVLLDPKTERILGATLVGAEAGELVHVFVALMQAGAPARAIVDAELVHPTFAEGLQSLVMRLDRYALSP